MQTVAEPKSKASQYNTNSTFDEALRHKSSGKDSGVHLAENEVNRSTTPATFPSLPALKKDSVLTDKRTNYNPINTYYTGAVEGGARWKQWGEERPLGILNRPKQTHQPVEPTLKQKSSKLSVISRNEASQYYLSNLRHSPQTSGKQSGNSHKLGFGSSAPRFQDSKQVGHGPGGHTRLPQAPTELRGLGINQGRRHHYPSSEKEATYNSNLPLITNSHYKEKGIPSWLAMNKKQTGKIGNACTCTCMYNVYVVHLIIMCYINKVLIIFAWNIIIVC